MRNVTFLAGIACIMLLVACGDAAIRWHEPEPAAQTVAGDRAAAARRPVAASQCPGSVRIAKDSTGDWYAAWWSVRPDSTADVVVARSTDGLSWLPAIRADTADVGRSGCRRPAPSIAADSGNVHVVYAMTAREGSGIFVTHSMDRGQLFHTPVAVVYGDLHAEGFGERTAVAARGNLVAVAYEDPNTNPTQIGFALSRSMAHLFEWRGLVSVATGAAESPSVTLGPSSVTVTWARAGEPSTRMMRIGEIRSAR